MTACQSKRSCLAERERTFRKSMYEAWVSKCMNCIEGAARQLDDFVPPPGFGPCCTQCGWELPMEDGRVKTHSGLCKECSHRGKTNKGNTKPRVNVKAYWGYREMAHKIATKKRRAA